MTTADTRPPKSVLVVGVYLANVPNHADHLVRQFGSARKYRVVQRWIAIGRNPSSKALADATVRVVTQKTPKFQLLNEMFAAYDDLADFDYIFLMDDDILIPNRFIDRFLPIQEQLGFALAQPARSPASYSGHRIVLQQPGLLARETLFVESGPLLSFTREAFALTVPYDLTSSQGWGYEFYWAQLAVERGWTMGVIDSLPVQHTLRKTGVTYDSGEAGRHMDSFLAANRHIPPDESFRVLRVYPLGGRDPEDYRALIEADWRGAPPRDRTLIGRARTYLRRYGWRKFAARLLRPWDWLGLKAGVRSSRLG